jgi:hypothetical protein
MRRNFRFLHQNSWRRSTPALALDRRYAVFLLSASRREWTRILGCDSGFSLFVFAVRSVFRFSFFDFRV